MRCMFVLNGEKKMDWLDELLLERITVPGQRYMEDHRLVIMGDSGLFISVYVRNLSGKRMEFNYNHAVLFAQQESFEEELPDVGSGRLGSSLHPMLCLDSCNANALYSKERVVSGTDLADRYDPFFDTLKYRRKPDEDVIRRCTEVLDYIDGKLKKASTINGIYELGIEEKNLHVAWLKTKVRRDTCYGYGINDEIEKMINTPDAWMIEGAGEDAPGCVCVFLDKKDQALKWIAYTRNHFHIGTEETLKRIRELEEALQADRKDPSQIKYFKMPGKEEQIIHPYYTWPKKLLRSCLDEAYRTLGSDDEIADRIVQGLERAIQTNTVEEYFQHNYEVNKAFIEKHYPFRLPDKWNAVVK